jgi:starvation-inducible outer membrane lipoprotein
MHISKSFPAFAAIGLLALSGCVTPPQAAIKCEMPKPQVDLLVPPRPEGYYRKEMDRVTSGQDSTQ